MRTTKAQRQREDAAAMDAGKGRKVTRADIQSTIRTLEANAERCDEWGRHVAASQMRAMADRARARLAEYGS